MYAIEITESSRDIHLFMFCSTLESVKEWIYAQLLRAMRADLATSVTLATMREIICTYATQLVNLDDLVETGEFRTYHDTIYAVSVCSAEDITRMLPKREAAKIGGFEECRRAFMRYAEVELAVAKQFCVEIHLKEEAADCTMEAINKGIGPQVNNLMWIDRQHVIANYTPRY